MTASLLRHAQGIALLLLAALGASCGSKAPPCSDPATQDLVKQILRESIETVATRLQHDAAWAARLLAVVPVNVTMARATKSEESIGKLTCAATLTTGVPPNVASLVGSPQAMLVPGLGNFVGSLRTTADTIGADVEYTSQMTEQKQHLVAMSGHQELAGALVILALHGAFPAFPKPAEAAATPAAVPSNAGLAGSQADAPPVPLQATRIPYLDCTNPRNDHQETVCEEAELHQLQQQLAQLYERAIAVPAHREEVRRRQAEWEASHFDACPAERACLEQALRKRVYELSR